jgi:hypothetical protein
MSEPKVKQEVNLEPLLHFNENRANQYNKAAPTRTKNFINSIVKKKMVLNEQDDGKTHINISEISKTKLGGLLDVNARTPFEHGELGKFNCLGGLWYYVIGDQNDHFRTLFGRACKNKGSKIEAKTVPGFKDIIADATWVKVKSNPEIAQLIIESKDIPFASYYVHSDTKLPTTTKTGLWYIPILNAVRLALINNLEYPDFSTAIK